MALMFSNEFVKEIIDYSLLVLESLREDQEVHREKFQHILFIEITSSKS